MVRRVDEAFYLPDGDRFRSTELTRGPWSVDAQHFGPPAGLLARACERAAPDLQLVRLTTEILRPVPIEVLDVAARVTKPGKRVRVVEAVLSADSQELAWARALLLRTVEQTVPDVALPPPPPRGDRIDEQLPFDRPDVRAIFDAVDVRLVEGTTARPGPAAAWFQVLVPLVAGEAPSGAQRAAIVADFGNGISWALHWDRWVFVNADLSLHLHRPPVGDRICLDARTMTAGNGVGLAEAALSDEHGRFGRSVQDLFLDELGS